MEENSNQTQVETDSSDVFLEGLENAPAPAEQPPVQAETAPAEQELPPTADSGEAAEAELPTVPAAPAPQVREADIQADLASFAAAFPEVFAQARDNPGVIPQCVWDAMRSQGLSLTAAYARYTTEQARAAADNQGNAARSTGSMRSAGSDAKNNDAFLSAFDA